MLPIGQLKNSVMDRISPFSAQVFQLMRQSQLLQPFLESQVLLCLANNHAVAEELIDQRQSEFLRDKRLKTEQDLATYLHRLGINRDILRANLKVSLVIEDVCSAEYKKRAQARFLQQKEQLDEVIYSLIRVSDSDRAHDIYLRLVDGEDSFPDLAVSYGEGPESANGGRVGPVKVLQAHRIVAEKLRSENEGTLIPPFKVDRWWLVLRIDQKRPAIFDDKICKSLSRSLFQEDLDVIVSDLISDIVGSGTQFYKSLEA